MIYKVLFIFVIFTEVCVASTLNVAVAANVSYAIKEIKKEFEKENPDIKIRVTLGSSGKLSAQIKNMAPYHVFMSANMKYPQNLFKEGLAITKPSVYAQGVLVCFSKKPRDFSKNIYITKEPFIKKIAIASAKTAPYGEAAMQALKNAKLYEDIKSKFIYGESVSQTISYTLIAADIGFIAKSALFTPQMKKYKKGTNYIDVDLKLYTPIKQGIVILTNAKGNDDAKKFYDFMLGKNGKKILNSFGYLVK